uniref:Uncharacterized protein n=1 Tax=viral metagenome TaxID=1070528 RepID=A0A6M3K0H1_9ZZZZ
MAYLSQDENWDDILSAIDEVYASPVSDKSPNFGDDLAFQSWYADWASKTGISPDPDDPLHKYDYRKAYSAGVEPQISPEDNKYHWPSEFKADDHPNRYVNGMDTKYDIPESESRAIQSVFAGPSAQTPPASAPPTGQTGALPTGSAEGPTPDRTILGTAGDIGVSAAKGIVALGESLVGLTDIPTLGHTGKLAKEYLGYDPKLTQETLDSLYSDAQKAANKRVQDVKGFVNTAVTMINNPSTIADAAIQSFPMMLGGAGAARALVSGGVKISPMVAAALFEGVLSSGSSAEQMRQQTEDGLLTLKQALSSVASGAGTAAFALAGGRVARRLGFADVDTLLAGGKGNVTKNGIIKRIIGGGISEGVFEELPQSVQEQIWQNAAMDKPLMEGALEAGATGMLTGFVMGGGANVFTGGEAAVEKPPAPTAETDLSIPTPESIKSGFEAKTYTPEDLADIKALWGDNPDVVKAVDELLGIAPAAETVKEPIPEPLKPESVKYDEKAALTPEKVEAKPGLFPAQTEEEGKAMEAEIKAQRAPKPEPPAKADIVPAATDRVAKLATDNQAEINAITEFDKKEEARQKLESIAETSKQRESRRTAELQSYLRTYFGERPTQNEQRIEAEKVAGDQAKKAGIIEHGGWTGTVYRGVGEKPSDAGDLGIGEYNTTSESSAKQYGKVTKKTITLKNPLKLTSEDASALAEKYKTLKGSETERKTAATKLSNDLRKQGYDGIVVDKYDTAGTTVVKFPVPPTKMEEDAQFKAWQTAAENRGYTPAEIKESYDFVQQEQEDKAIKAWENKAKLDEETISKEPLYHTGYNKSQLDSTKVSISAIEDDGTIITVRATDKSAPSASEALTDIDNQMETYYSLLDCLS